MRPIFLEFVTNKNQRMLINLKDIRSIREGNPECDKGYCKIFFYSDVNVQQYVKEDYQTIINKMLQALNQ